MKLAAILLLILPIVRGYKLEPKIIDGMKSMAKPWMVALRHTNMRCGGVMYTKSLILSAAHCVEFKANEWTAHVNRFNLTLEHELGGSKEKILKFEKHPKYQNNPNFDISAWWVNSDSADRTAVVLDNGSEADDKTIHVTIMGWGKTERRVPGDKIPIGGSSNILLEAQVPLTYDDKCIKRYPQLYDPNTMICTGYEQSGTNTCQGDSGGPIFRTRDNQIVLIGIVGGGAGCGYQNYYSYHTKISNDHVAKFIKKYEELYDPENIENLELEESSSEKYIFDFQPVIPKPITESIPPTVIVPVVNPDPPTTNPVINPSSSAIKPVIYPAPRAAKPVINPSPPVAKPVINPSPPVDKPVIIQAPPAVKPVVKPPPPAVKPVIKTAPQVAKPVINPSPSIGEPIIKQSSPAVNPVLKPSTTLKNPINIPSPPSYSPYNPKSRIEEIYDEVKSKHERLMSDRFPAIGTKQSGSSHVNHNSYSESTQTDSNGNTYKSVNGGPWQKVDGTSNGFSSIHTPSYSFDDDEDITQRFQFHSPSQLLSSPSLLFRQSHGSPFSTGNGFYFADDQPMSDFTSSFPFTSPSSLHATPGFSSPTFDTRSLSDFYSPSFNSPFSGFSSPSFGSPFNTGFSTPSFGTHSISGHSFGNLFP